MIADAAEEKFKKKYVNRILAYFMVISALGFSWKTDRTLRDQCKGYLVTLGAKYSVILFQRLALLLPPVAFGTGRLKPSIEVEGGDRNLP